MAEERLALLLKRFAAAARAHSQAMENLDEEQAALHAHMIARLHESIEREEAGGRERLLDLTDSADKAVAGMAAVYSIRHDPPRCLAVLRRLADEGGLLGFRAGVAVQRWEAGEWEDQPVEKE